MRTSGRAALLAEPTLHRAGPGGRKHIKGGAKLPARALSLSNLPPTPATPGPTIDVRQVCAPRFLSCHSNDLERWTLKPSVHHNSRVLDKPCHSSQTSQCYSSILFRRWQENPPSKKRREWRNVPACGRRGWGVERESGLAPPFICFLPPGLPCAKWAQPGVLLYLKSSLRSSRLSLTFLCFIFTGFPLPCLLATAILDSFSLFCLPNKYNLNN